jgi:hypothetical protein
MNMFVKNIYLSMSVSKQVIYTAGVLALFITKSAIAQNTFFALSNSCENLPEPVSLSKNTTKLDKKAVPIAQNTSLINTTNPSFWWATEQFDPFGGKLVRNWLAYPQAQQINLVVNWQLWTLLDYLGRYRFVNQFGTVAREYGYSLNVFNQKKQCLATYKYNSQSNPPKWELNLEKLGKDSLQIE